MEINTEGLKIKQEIKEEEIQQGIKEEFKVCFEVIDEESYSIETVKKESDLNKKNQEKHYLDLIYSQSGFLAEGIKQENKVKQENEDIEFREEEINYEWSELTLNKPDPLALPDIQNLQESTQEINLERLVIKQKINKDNEVCFEVIDEENCTHLVTVEKVNVLSETARVEHCLDVIDGQSGSVGGIKEGVDGTEPNEDGELTEEEINCEWSDLSSNESDPLALPETQDVSEAPNCNSDESSSRSSTDSSSRIIENNTDKHKDGGSSDLKLQTMSRTRKKPIRGRESIRSHSLKTNARIEIFKCTECDFSFNQLSCLKDHLTSHSKIGSFICEKCGFSSNRIQSLNTHMMIHTGERPFKCEECDGSFSRLHSLKIHMMTHTGEKPITCNICGYTCIVKSSLIRHMSSHTGIKPFKCIDCDSCFTQSTHLKRHVMLHTGEKPFKCAICGFSFIRSSHLKRHMLTHSKERTFKCKICNYASIQSQGLKNHIMKRHKEEETKKARHIPEKIPPTKKKAYPTRNCKVCSAKIKEKTGKAGKKPTCWWCPDCTVGLCVPRCFKIYHNKTNH